MKIAVFSDIHGNYRALAAALEYALKKEADTFVFLGDYLGEFAYPRKTMQMLRDLQERYQCFFIRGNKEDYWLNRRKNINDDWKDGNNSVYCMNYNFAHLTPEDLDFFEKLPICTKLSYNGMPDIMLCHGAPSGNTVKLIPSNGRFTEIVEACECDYILCGHTHIQQLLEYSGKIVLNPGAIGVPLHSKNGNTQFMLLQAEAGEWKHEFVSIAYEKEEVVRDLWESGLYENSPYWCRITEHLIRTGEVSHGEVLTKVIALSKDAGYQWYNIPDEYWKLAVEELLG